MDKEDGIKFCEKIPWREYINLYTVETTLRWLIKHLMDQNPSKIIISKEILKEAEENRKLQIGKEEESKIPKTLYSDPLVYLDFPKHYIRIFEENWELFRPIFLHITRIKDDLKTLEPLRHNIAHMRPLRKEQKDQLNVVSRRILRHIWDYINQKYVKAAWEYEKDGFFDKAVETLEKGLKDTRNELIYEEGDPWVAYNLGKMLKNHGKLEEAKKWLNYAKINMPLDDPYREMVEEELKNL
ncbi:MAG: hypothetical protein ABIM02_07700 [candidate division WOR-3 bacterium]